MTESSKDENEIEYNLDGTMTLIQKEETTETGSMSYIGNGPLILYSPKKPNYPITYSCEHILLLDSNTSNDNNNEIMFVRLVSCFDLVFKTVVS